MGRDGTTITLSYEEHVSIVLAIIDRARRGHYLSVPPVATGAQTTAAAIRKGTSLLGRLSSYRAEITLTWEELDAIADVLYGREDDEALFTRIKTILDDGMTGEFENAGGPTHWQEARPWQG